MPEVIRVGNGCGFWGDRPDAPAELARHGALDYLTLEYLAELTLSILAHLRSRDPQAGFATDFLDALRSLVPILAEQPGLRVITNAGGMNPAACARRAAEVFQAAGLGARRIGVVSGDDLLPRLGTLMAAGHDLRNLDTGQELAAVIDRVASANAYLGAEPIAAALRQGAGVVITGRVADAALTLGPALFEFGWPAGDWDRRAGGVVAGHLIECGAQVTGGLWCHWDEAPDLAGVGYPIAVLAADGTCRITKPAGTGGAVNRETVTEQLVYEIGDPAHYLTPDVDVDFRTVEVAEAGPDVVEVRGATGRPAPEALKVSIAYRDGFTASGLLTVFGPGAVATARAAGWMVLERVRRAGFALAQARVECLGTGASVPGVVAEPPGLRETVLRITVRDPRREAIERFARELAPLVTAGPPGIAGYASGRPAVRAVLGYWPALVSRAAVVPHVRVATAERWLAEPGPVP